MAQEPSPLPDLPASSTAKANDIRKVAVTDSAMDFSAKRDGICNGFWGGLFLSCDGLWDVVSLAKDGKRAKFIWG